MNATLFESFCMVASPFDVIAGIDRADEGPAHVDASVGPRSALTTATEVSKVALFGGIRSRPPSSPAIRQT
jgi:hypothetical protein